MKVVVFLANNRQWKCKQLPMSIDWSVSRWHRQILVRLKLQLFLQLIVLKFFSSFFFSICIDCNSILSCFHWPSTIWLHAPFNRWKSFLLHKKCWIFLHTSNLVYRLCDHQIKSCTYPDFTCRYNFTGRSFMWNMMVKYDVKYDDE